MIETYFYTIIAVSIVSLVSFIGVLFLAFNDKLLKHITVYMVSISTGTLLGASFFHLIPEAIEKNENTNNVWPFLLLGMLLFFILEKIIHWRHCHVPTSKNHPHPLGKMNLVGDAFHNFLDGIVIAGSFLININLGVVTTLSVILHEIPQEIADFGVLIYAGYTKSKALTLNFLIALTSIIGAAVVLLINNQVHQIKSFIIPFTAGGFIYIATTDLLPELKKETSIKKSIIQIILIIVSIWAMTLLS